MITMNSQGWNLCSMLALQIEKKLNSSVLAATLKYYYRIMFITTQPNLNFVFRIK